MLDREHLCRLANVWVKSPIYFITVCTESRRQILASTGAAEVITESWKAAAHKHGWVVGRYVIMPDHVHFFASPQPDAKLLSSFVRDWKKWTARNITKFAQIVAPVWQAEFFDHVLRSIASYSEKWNYVRENPVRAGLVKSAESWPYAGECEILGVQS